MKSLLSNLVNNLSVGIHRIKCKHGHDDKTCRIKYNYSDCFLEHSNFKYYLIEYKCLCCTKNYQHKFYGKLKKQFFNKKRFFNTKTFSNHDNNRFILLLQKSVYLYEYINDWEKFNEASLPEKEDFYT